MARVRCPKCQTLLDLDDADLGQDVECAECTAVFVAEAVPRRPTRRDEDDEGDRKALRRRLRRERREEREYAHSLVRPPAIALLISIAIGLLWRVADMTYMVVTGGTPFVQAGPADGDESITIGAIIGTVTTVLFSPLIVVACLQMMKLRMHKLAITACVLSLTPCAGCFLIGFPIGVWGLVILNRTDVRDAFD